MSKDDEFFDKYVETPSKKKGSAKKDLFGITKNADKIENTKSNEEEKITTDLNEIKENSEKRKTEVVEELPDKPKRAPRKTTKKEEVAESIIEDTGTEYVEEVEQQTQEIEVLPERQPEEKEQRKSRRKTQRDINIEDYNTNYITKTLSQTINESMIPYSEFVIMDRALPRVEDGLKPVQRRVLYSMMQVGVFPDRPYKKSATIVGECMGNYHPHGDSSIYETLVRMAQPFNMGELLIDGNGNFGSIDGDSAAAMRYTEAKLTPIALELLRDLEKDTVPWTLNFDDRLKEPVMLPGRFPNLLVNGCQGIAVGLATNIPTHNLLEACNAVIAYIDNRNISIQDLMKIMPAPDFPSGAYILDNSEIEQVYATGKGKIFIRSKINIENADNGKKNIVITEIPYQVNKAAMLQKIAKYKEANPNGPLSAVHEIVDESDKTGIRAVVKLKREAKINSILNILYKYCDVQTTFNANIVAIADGKPKQMGLKEILEYYVNYQQKIIYNRTNYDLEQALKKEHILEGLLIAIKNIDDVVKIIKNSKNVTDAKITLIKTFELSEVQAQAILDMRLARLTSLEVNKLITDLNRLRDLIKRYTAIVKSPALQMKVVKSELQEIVKTYATPRKSKFLSAEEHFEDSSSVLQKIENEGDDIETYHLISTPANTLKTVNLKSYKLVVKELSANPTLIEIPSISFKIDNNKDAHIFTNIGNCIKLPVTSIGECKFRDKGTALFNLCKNVDAKENIVSIMEFDNTIEDACLLFTTKLGMIKITKMSEYNSTKSLITGIKLAKNDEVVNVEMFNPHKKLVMFTSMGNAVKLDLSDVAITGRNSAGVKGIALDKGDYVVGSMQTAISDAFTLFMSDGSAKIVKQSEVQDSARNRKGLNFINVKSKNSTIVYAGKLSTKTNYVALTSKEKLLFVRNNEMPIDTRIGGGKIIVKDKIKNIYPFVESK